MTDKKITDEEIIKRLERCVKRGNRNYDTDIVLDLINRQKAEIERLKECPKCVYEYDGEITEYCVQGACPNFKTVEQIKAEAYKEFADMVKKNIKEVWNYDNGTCSCVLVLTKDIDKILKEMVGGEE